MDDYFRRRNSQFELLSQSMKYKIAFIGDSITDEGRWNELLEREDIINRGIAGDTSSGILNRIDNLNIGIEKAFLMFGVNDFTETTTPISVFERYKKIILKLENKNIQPIIQSTLNVNIGDTFHNDKINELNNMLKEFSITQKLIYIDLNQYFSPTGKLNTDYSFDGLHLNGAGYFLWRDILKKYI